MVYQLYASNPMSVAPDQPNLTGPLTGASTDPIFDLNPYLTGGITFQTGGTGETIGGTIVNPPAQQQQYIQQQSAQTKENAPIPMGKLPEFKQETITPPDKVQVGSRQLPRDLVTAQALPGQASVPGYTATMSDAGGGEDNADQEAQQGQEQEPSYQPIAQDDPLLQPVFSTGQPAPSAPPLPGGVSGAGGVYYGGNGAPVQTGAAPGFNYPLGGNPEALGTPQLPPSGIPQGAQTDPNTINAATPEWQDAYDDLEKMKRTLLSKMQQMGGSPYEQQQAYWSTRPRPSLMGHVARGLVMGMNHNQALTREMLKIPQNFGQAIATPAFKNQQSIYDDLQDKFIQIGMRQNEMKKELAYKRQEAQEKIEARKNIPPGVKQAAIQQLMQMPTYMIGADGNPIMGPDKKPVMDPGKLQAIDIYISAGLLDPNLRQAAMFTFPAGAQLAMKKDALAVAHAQVQNHLNEKTSELRLQKLQNSMAIDAKLKQSLLVLRKQEQMLNQLRSQQITTGIANTIEDNARATRKEIHDLQIDKQKYDTTLNHDKLAWSKIAGLDPKKSMFHGFTSDAIDEAKKNVGFINMYQSGQLDYLMQAYSQTTGKPSNFGTLTNFMSGASKEDKEKVAGLALKLENAAKGKTITPVKSTPKAAPQRKPSLAEAIGG